MSAAVTSTRAADAASSSAATGAEEFSVFVHPLVLMNMCDHAVRSEGSPAPVFGALFGVQTGLRVHVYTCAEMTMQAAAGVTAGAAAGAVGGQAGNGDAATPVINSKFLEVQKDLMIKAFPAYELLGWYSCSRALTAGHYAVHEQMLNHNELPLLLHLDPHSVSPEQRELPLWAYTAAYHGASLAFTRMKVKIEADESESIVSDAVSNIRTQDPTESPLVASLRSSAVALRLLQERLSVIHQYLTAVKAGAIQADRTLLRQISAVCARIPVSDSSKLSKDMLKDLDDGMLVSMLATMTKTAAALASFTEKHNVVVSMVEREGRGPGGLRDPLHALPAAGVRRHRGPF